MTNDLNPPSGMIEKAPDNQKDKRKRTDQPEKPTAGEQEEMDTSAPGILTQLEDNLTQTPSPPSLSPAQKNDQSLPTVSSRLTQNVSITIPRPADQPKLTSPQTKTTEAATSTPNASPWQKSQLSITAQVEAYRKRSALEKYTDAEMPLVQFASPSEPLSNIDIDLVVGWEGLPGGKLLALPFGAYATDLSNHNTLNRLIFGAVIDITKSHSVSVCPPRQCHTSKRAPICFLIYNLAEEHKQALLERCVWSSTNITFQAMSFGLRRPDYLFTIKDLTTMATDDVSAAVHKVWHDEASKAFIDTICNQATEANRSNTRKILEKFVNSMWTTRLDTKKKGNIIAPGYRVYASGEIINDDDTWYRLRDYFASREYRPWLQSPGTNFIPTRACSLCHGIDHPRGLCPFPSVAGWNGPTRREDPPLTDPMGRGSNIVPQGGRNRAKIARFF